MGPVIRLHAAAAAPRRPVRRRQGGAVPRERPVGADHRDRAAGRRRHRRRARRSRSCATSCEREGGRRRRTADGTLSIVIRGGTVVDGTGAPGRVGRRRGRATARSGRSAPNLRGDRELDAVGLRRRAGLHRHPHALRRPGVLGPGPAAVVVPGRHHGGRRQLRLHHRAHPPRAPRRDRAHARERRGHGRARRSPRASCGTSRPTPSTWSSVAQPRHGAQLHRLRRAQLGAALRDGRRRLRARRDRRRDRARCAGSSPRRSTPARPGSRPASPTRTAAWTGSPSRAASPRATRSRRCSSPPAAPGKGVVLATAGEQCTYADMYEYQPRIGRPFTYPLFALAERSAPPAAGAARGGRRRAASQVWPQVTPRPLTMQFTMDSPFSLNVSPVFGDAHGRRPRRAASPRTAIPTWRARAAADLEQVPMRPRWETCEVSESERFPELEGRRVDELARERGCGPLDVICEVARRRGPRTRGSASTSPTTTSSRCAHLLTHEQVALGLSDAGAHVGQLCDAPLPTDLLGNWVRERERHADRAGGAQADRRAGRHVRLRRPRLRARGELGPTCASSIRRRSVPARCGACATSRPTASASPPRSRPACATCWSTARPIRRDEAQLDSAALRPGMRPEIV